MTPKLLRLAYAIEFLLALMAIFTAWSEIGGQDALDLMHWGWKIGFSLSLSFAIVAYTAALVSQEGIWTLSSARWLAAIVLLVSAMAAVTYFYALQEQTSGDTDEGGTISLLGLHNELGLSNGLRSRQVLTLRKRWTGTRVSAGSGTNDSL